MSNSKITITTDTGDVVEAMAPVIVSASRSTDIPAFYSKWFFNRLEKGYCVWCNPFNQKPSYVTFKNCKVIVFWTKNPRPIFPYLNTLDRRGIHYYFQVTLNDYEKENFEPNVPPLVERIETFKELSCMVGKDKVIWRFDPLIVTSGITPRELLRRIWRIGNALKGHTEKLVFSFVDVRAYRKVQANLIKETGFFDRNSVVGAELSCEQRREVVDGLIKMQEAWAADGGNVTLATCGEEADYKGVEHNSCIDGALMERLWSNDKVLVHYLHTGELAEPDLFGEFQAMPKKCKDMKDKGQRKACGCMVSKDIGMYNTCQHLCVYCYANTSRECVFRNVRMHRDDKDQIVGYSGS